LVRSIFDQDLDTEHVQAGAVSSSALWRAFIAAAPPTFLVPGLFLGNAVMKDPAQFDPTAMTYWVRAIEGMAEITFGHDPCSLGQTISLSVTSTRNLEIVG
jgi:hypothetical protein